MVVKILLTRWNVRDYFTLSKLVSKETEFKTVDVIKKERFCWRVCDMNLQKSHSKPDFYAYLYLIFNMGNQNLLKLF